MNFKLFDIKNFLIIMLLLLSLPVYAATKPDAKPDWIDVLPDDGEYIYAVGVGEDAKIDNARQTALQDARAQLSKIVDKKVTNMCRDFIKHSNNKSVDDLTKYGSDLSAKVSKNVILASQLKDSYTIDGKTKTYYALIRVKSKTLTSCLEEARSVMNTQPDYRSVENDLENMVSSIKSRFNTEIAERTSRASAAKTQAPAEPEVVIKDGKEPGWVKRFPSDRAYYIGIGQGENLEGAKANAINTVAGQIKVGIKSQIKDYMSEVNGVTDEDVSVNITLSVKDNIEDVEIYDAWLSPKGEFWVYARLNIATYQRKQLEKLENAKMNALDYLTKCDEEVLPVLAFKDAFMGYYFIAPYITKAVKANYNGKDVILVNELMSRMNKISTNISMVQTEDNLVMGKINAKPLQVNFTMYGNDERMGNLPVSFSVDDSEAVLTQEGVTNADGEVTCVISKIKSNEAAFTLNAKPDFETLVKGLIDDPAQQKYFAGKVAQIAVPKKQVVIEIERPRLAFKLTTREGFKNAEYEAKMDNLATSFKNKFSDKLKADFVDDNAQYTVEMIVSGTVAASDGSSNFVFAKPTIAIKIFDNASKAEIYSIASQEIKQGANTAIKAVQKAFEKFVSSELNGFVNEIVNKGIN